MSKAALEAVKKKFASEVISEHAQHGDETLIMKAARIQAIAEFCRDDPALAMDMLSDLTAVDYLMQRREIRFEVVYHLYSTTKRHRLRIKLPVGEAEAEVDSVTGVWKSANWMEREVWDMYGIRFEGHPEEAMTSTSEQLARQERVALPTETMTIMMGPVHPAMHGTVRVVITVDGERIVHADVQVGYLHRGFEKECEGITWGQIFPYTDRLNYVSPILNNVGYAMAVEKLLGIEVPERAEYIRVISGELSRIGDHLTCIAAIAMEMGAFSIFLYCVRARDEVYDRLEDLTGARVTHSYCRVGGVKDDTPDGWLDKVRDGFGEITSPALWGAPRASTTTCARITPTACTTASTSTCRSWTTETPSAATTCAWRRSASPCASSTRPSIRSGPGR
jgi:NADH:ubiquinone oxidoreductase subunit C